MNKTIVEGVVEYQFQFWDDDPPSGYFINGGMIEDELDFDKLEHKRVRITVEILENEDE
jgi:hypothetical protein